MENFEQVENFSSIIIERINSNDTDIFDIITSYCEEKELEIESIIPLLSPSLLQRIEEQAVKFRLIKTTTHSIDFE